VRYHLPRERQWFRIAEYLLREESPDLMAVMFDGVDKLQHQAWLFIDPAEQQGERSEYHQRMRRLCLEYFRQLDSFIERLVTTAGPGVQVYLASDHGFTATTEIVRINAYLHEKGYLHWKEAPDTAAGKRREDSMFAYLDWKNTIAYCRTPSSNGIHIRIAKRPGDPGISPAEYTAVRARLIADLQSLSDPVSGERIIREIHTRESVFAGAAMEEAPDLLLVLRDFGFVSIKNRLPVVEARSQLAGTHHPDGVFIASGPGIRRGVMVGTRNITDVGATLLYSLGLEVPADFEGQVPAEIYLKPHLARQPIRVGAGTSQRIRDHAGPVMGDEEKAKIMTQLQMLGYME
jgi:predicted AlkP superfamily phosphohydrolase/phosphomutase